MDNQATVVDFGEYEDEKEEVTSERRELKAELRVQIPDKEVVHYPIYSGDNSIGRLETNDICIFHPTVSSKHLLITVTGNQSWLTDLGSTNKTRMIATITGSFSGKGNQLEPHAKVGNNFK